MTSHRQDMVDQLSADGFLPAEWRPAFETVPRQLFVSDRYEDEEAWLRAAHTDRPVSDAPATSAYTASADVRPPVPAPSLTAELLERLRLKPGMEVLEAGTAGGYSTALLATRLGVQAVTAVEPDPSLAEQTRVRLASAGLDPEVVTGDAAAGRPERAPFDRVLGSAPVMHVPPAWVSQCQPGGGVVALWGDMFHHSALVDLCVGPDGVARGGFATLRGRTPGRTDAGAWRWLSRYLRPEADRPVRGSALGRADLLDESAAFTTGLALPGVRGAVRHTPGSGTVLCLVDAVSGSWALCRAPGQPEDTGSQVRQKGPRLLFDELERAHRLWEEAGRPSPDRFGMTVTADRQSIWIDDEASVFSVTAHH